MRGIIFDFDDTLVETTVFFDRAKDKFALRMQELGFPVADALKVLNQFDIRNVLNCGGFLKECFPRALVQTYHHFCALHGQEVCCQTSKWMEQLGWEVFDAPVIVIEGAEEVVRRLSSEFRLILATKGEEDVQMKRLRQSGLARYFEKVYVLPDKTAVEYRDIASENNLRPASSWVIGNSMKGDINPGIETGFNCIHVYHHNTWDFEEEPPIGDFFSVKKLGEITDIITASMKKKS